MSIAVLVNPDQAIGRFGRYLAEILRAEGFADHTVVELGGQQPTDQQPTDQRLADLSAFDLVVVARQRPSKAQVEWLLAYASSGGRLVLVRPSYLLATTLGLAPTHTMVAPAYVRPGAASQIASDVPQEPIETHLPADMYAPDALPEGAVVAAELNADVRTPTGYPAVVDMPYGAGRVVVFTYDLPHTVALIRQGDPNRVGGRGAGLGAPYRMQDLLIGYADPLCWHLPQADIHAMLLGNAVNQLACRPQPRWWYYPEPETRSTLVLDSDDDWSAPEHFDALLEAVESYDARITIYLMSGTTKGTIATPEKVAAWRARGHSFGVHHDPSDPRYDGEDREEILDQVIRKDVADFVRRYGDVPRTNRNHCVAWKEYVDPPKVYAELGIDMDLNAMGTGASWLRYLTGSARPMRFVDVDGTLVDCFQQSTQAFDDLSVKDLLTADAIGQAGLTRRLMEENVTRYFAPLSMLSHPVSFATYSSAYMHQSWTAARELGLPMWSAFEWAAFTRARDRARIHDVCWNGNVFHCQVTGRSPAGALTLSLPVAAERVTQASVDGEPATVSRLTVFGWPSVLVRVALDADTERTRAVSVALRP